MAVDWRKVATDLGRLNAVTNQLADEVSAIRLKMPGRGIFPAESPAVEAKLHEIENKLRMIGANQADIIPY